MDVAHRNEIQNLQFFMVRLLLIYLVIICFLSLNPWLLPGSGRVIGFVTRDMLDHAAAYNGLSLLMLMSLKKWQQPAAVKIFVVLVSCGSIGILLEYCQYWFTSTRHFSFHDIIANIFGAALGLFCFGLLKFSRIFKDYSS